MGTLHGITQVSPSFIYSGAALLCKKEFADKVKAMAKKIRKESYMDIQESQIEFSIHNPNIDAGYFVDEDKKLYVIIKAGGKWGYSDNFIKLLEELAPYLEDAIFYLDYEWGNVVQFKIENGKLHYVTVAEDTDNLHYIEKVYKADKAVLLALYQSHLLEVTDDLWEDNKKEALRLANKTIKLNTKNWKSYQLKGAILSKINKYEEAIECFNKALKYIPDTEVKITQKTDDGSIKTIAIVKAYKALQHHPTEIDRYWFDYASNQIISTYKNIYIYLGWAYQKLKQYDEAFIHYLKAEKIVPTYHNNTPLHYLSSYFIEIEQYDRATEYCNQLIKRGSSISDIAIGYYNKACIYAKKNDSEKAIYFLTIALDIQPHKYKDHSKKDEDLKNIHHLEVFKALVK